MPLSAGARLGHYEIVSAIGAGGMGEVYKARDTRLDRSVAIKVLPSHIAAREDLRARFEREARAVSSLNHPHICSLFDVGQQDGTDYIVLEHLEGETLASRVERGPLPLDQTLKYSMQIADAVDRAHRSGVVHRDLKPGNIMLTRDGVKVLDFGLAKTAPKSAADGATMTMALTSEGTVLGTPQYMSPEQISGSEADERSDIFAFGCVLYEMVTGKRAFDGKTKASVIGAILAAEPPPMSTLQPVTPHALERLVARCLAKDPEERYQSLRDVWLDLRSAGESPPPPTKPKRSWLPWAAAATLALAAALAILWLRTPAPTEIGATEFTIDGSQLFSSSTLAVSPDGRFVAFSGGPINSRSLWLRALDSAQATPLPGTEGGGSPFWSPDSRNIAFFADGKLKRIATAGGRPQIVCDARAEGGTWNQEGTILFSQPDGVHRVAESGGTPRRVTAPNLATGEVRHLFPSFLPDGKRFLYWVRAATEGAAGIYAASLERPRDSIRILHTDAQAIYVPPVNNHSAFLLFPSGGALMAQPVDDSLRLRGSPLRLADEVATATGTSRASFSAGGATLAYRGGDLAERQMVRMGRNGHRLQEVGAFRQYESLDLSPDGQHVAFGARDAGGNEDVWVLEFRRGVETRLTTEPSQDYSPVWSPDGRQIAFCSNRDGVSRIFRMSSGGGAEEPLTEAFQVRDWSRDGRHLLYVRQTPGSGNDLLAVPLTASGAEKPIPIAQTRFNEPTASFAPDGRWVVYQSNESGSFQIYVQPFPEPASGGRRRVQISRDGGFRPRWRADGKELFYLSANDEIMAAPIRILPEEVQVESPKALFRYSVGPFLNYSYDVTANGQEFVVLETKPGVDAPLTVVANWQARLKK